MVALADLLRWVKTLLSVLGGAGQYAGGVAAGIYDNPFGGGAQYSTNSVSGPMTSSLRPQMRPGGIL